ncbi:hypothetical protein V6N12_008312 [Hibiscus sabdariffa]|uniref:Uncharacterized protein n=1 Tax=Hibiscus sabdariffa TaxID=183260 RepID=A0ABR2B3B1_9ROSI
MRRATGVCYSTVAFLSPDLRRDIYSLIADANKSLFLSAAITQFYSERGEEWRTWGNGKNSKWKLGLKRSIEFEYHYHTISKSLRYEVGACVERDAGGWWGLEDGCRGVSKQCTYRLA